MIAVEMSKITLNAQGGIRFWTILMKFCKQHQDTYNLYLSTEHKKYRVRSFYTNFNFWVTFCRQIGDHHEHF